MPTDKERLDWLTHNFWNGWSVFGSHRWEGGKATFTVAHKSGEPHFTRDDLRDAIDAAMETDDAD